MKLRERPIARRVSVPAAQNVKVAMSYLSSPQFFDPQFFEPAAGAAGYIGKG